MFIGRQSEIDQLNELYTAKKAHLIAVYGRRRIGKSSLIDYFCSDKESLKFEGLESQRTPRQIKNFIQDLNKQVEDPFLESIQFKDWDHVFQYLTQILEKQNEKIIWFFDEFQWLAANQTKMVGLIKKYWDNHWKHSNKLMLILCGSVASYMIDKVIKSSSLYGRIDLEICLKGLLPAEIKTLLQKKRSDEEIFKYLLIFGGVPRYFEFIDTKKSFEQNIQNLFFASNARLLKEYEKIFYSQFREHRTYEKIVLFLSHCPRSLNEIANHLAMTSGGGLKSYLTNLEKALFITSYVPYNRKQNFKLKKYKLTDEYIRFFLKYIYPNQKIIEENHSSKTLFSTLVKDKWDPWMGFAFENFCLKNAMYIAEKMGFANQVKGYGPIFVRDESGFQIDLAYERFDNVITICEMKYYNKEIPTKVITDMEKKLSSLKVAKGVTIEKALISQLGGDKQLKASEYFHHDICVKDLMES